MWGQVPSAGGVPSHLEFMIEILGRLVRNTAFRVGATIVLLILVLWRSQPQKLLSDSGKFGLQALLLALLLTIPFLYFKSLRWMYMLRYAGSDASFSEAALSLVGGMGLALLTPARLGEVARVAYLRDSRKLRLSALVMLDKLFDVIVLVLLSVAGAWRIIGWPAGLAFAVVGCLGLVVTLFPKTLHWTTWAARGSIPLARKDPGDPQLAGEPVVRRYHPVPSIDGGRLRGRHPAIRDHHSWEHERLARCRASHLSSRDSDQRAPADHCRAWDSRRGSRAAAWPVPRGRRSGGYCGIRHVLPQHGPTGNPRSAAGSPHVSASGQSQRGVRLVAAFLAITTAANSFSSVWHNLSQEPGLYVWRAGGSVVIIALSLVVGRFAESRMRHSAHVATLGANPSVLLARIVRFCIWFLGLLWVLAIFSVPFTALAAVVGVAALALSLSLQDLLKNLIAGIYMLAERPFHIGDVITVQGTTGLIEDIQMRVTFLRTEQGERVVIPNQLVFTQMVVNTTSLGVQSACIQVEAPRSINADDVSKRVLEAVSEATDVATNPPPRLETVTMTPDTVKWALHVWLKPGSSISQVILALGKAIPEATIGQPLA